MNRSVAINHGTRAIGVRPRPLAIAALADYFDSWDDSAERGSPAAASLLDKIEDPSIWRAIFPEDSLDKPPSRA